MTKSCFTCENFMNRDPLSKEPIGTQGNDFRCSLKFLKMKPFTLWPDEFNILKKEALDAAEHCEDWKVV